MSPDGSCPVWHQLGVSLYRPDAGSPFRGWPTSSGMPLPRWGARELPDRLWLHLIFLALASRERTLTKQGRAGSPGPPQTPSELPRRLANRPGVAFPPPEARAECPMIQTRVRPGFTLIELLVVIAIIAILI